MPQRKQCLTDTAQCTHGVITTEPWLGFIVSAEHLHVALLISPKTDIVSLNTMPKREGNAYGYDLTQQCLLPSYKSTTLAYSNNDQRF